MPKPRATTALPRARTIRGRLVAALTGVALVLGPATLAAADEAAPRPPAGAPGIGDPYYPLDGNGGIDVVHYDVHGRYLFGSGRLRGWTDVTLRATRDVSSFNLDLLLPVRRVRLDGAAVPHRKRGPYAHELQVLAPLAVGEVHTVRVRYDGHPGRAAYAGESNWLADRREVVTMNQPHMAPWWFPANDHPRDKASLDVHVTVPRSKQVVSNGERVGRVVHGRLATTHWRAAEPMAPYLAFFAAGSYAVSRGTSDAGLAWYSAVSKQLSPRARARMLRLMDRHAPLVEWLADRLGVAYPFSTTGGLMTGLPVGFALENQTRPTYPAHVGHAVVVHEVAHQWFGDSVAVAGWRDIWLNEGFATFVEQLWTEDQGGRTAAEWLEDSHTYYGDPSRRGFWRQDIADPGADLDDLFSEAVYNRGGMAVQALRQRIGEDDFWALLRTWLERRAGGNGSTEQFVALAEEVSGEDLAGFFTAWLRAPERPARTPENGFPG